MNEHKIDNENKTFQEKVQPYTLEKLNSRLDRAEKNFAEGRGIPAEDVETEMLEYVMAI